MVHIVSHIKLPEEKRNVTVFTYATYGDDETIEDHYSYRLGEKSFEVGRVETSSKRMRSTVIYSKIQILLKNQ